MKKPYQTKQRVMILEYFESHPQDHLTAESILAHFEDTGAPMSKATVYRTLEHLVDEGFIVQYFIDPTKRSCYTLAHGEEEPFYHAVCTTCEKVYHVPCHELTSMMEHMENHHRFKVDPERLVLYGTCSQCTKTLEEA